MKEREPYKQYIYDVIHNNVLVCKYVKQAVKRHTSDLKKSKDKDYPFYFDETEPEKIVKFASLLQHYEGEFNGKPIILEPWQEFIVYMLYGWKKKSDKTRRFNKGFVFVARKNGKTTLASVLMLYALFAEAGAGVYSIATKKDQAAISFNKIKEFVKRNPNIKSLVNIFYSTITYERSASKLEALSSEHDTLDGLNPSFVLADEVAQYKNSKLIDVMQSGMYARKEPMLLEITTGSESLSSIGFQEFERSQKVLNGIIEDDNFFCVLYTLDDSDNWKNEKNYIKANPNLGVTVSLDSLVRAKKEAEIAPYKEAEFKVKNLNLFENVTQSWISDKKAITAMENYRKYSINKRDLKDIPCFGAVDLSKRLDFTSYTLFWYLEDIDKYVAKHCLYIPSSQIEEKLKKDSPMIRAWINEGWIKAVEGETIDYQYLVNDIKEDLKHYKIFEVAYDPALSNYFVSLCDKDIPELNIVSTPPNRLTMGPFNVDYEEMVVSEKLCDNNPVWRWMLSNCTIQVGSTGLVHLEKIEDRKTSRRIDVVVTSSIAHGRLQNHLRSNQIQEVDLSQYVY